MILITPSKHLKDIYKLFFSIREQSLSRKILKEQDGLMSKFGQAVTKIQSSIHNLHWRAASALQVINIKTCSHITRRISKKKGTRTGQLLLSSSQNAAEEDEMKNSPSLRSCRRFSWHEKSSFTLMFTTNVAIFPGLRGNWESVSSSFQLRKSPYSFSVLK